MQLFFKALLDLLLPSFCLACDKPLGTLPELLFCPECLERLRFIESPLCPCCGRVYLVAPGGDHHCGTCLATPYHFSRARAIFLYQEPLKEVIHRFKYQGKTACLPSFARFARNLPQLGEVQGADWIVPVPLHPTRLQERGFNQALLLAKAFPEAALAREAVVRTRHTAPQVGLNPKERQANVKGAFAVPDPAQVKGKSVLLIDDLYTTGSTVKECARVLRRAGASRVEVLTVARVRHG